MPDRDPLEPLPKSLAAIRASRTVRRFDPGRPVPDELLREALEHACLAPSAFNLQPWRFLVVRDRRSRQRLRTCVGNSPRIGEAPVSVILLGIRNPISGYLDPIVESMQELGVLTPAGAAELRGRARSWAEHHKDLGDWSRETSMLAAATLMLSAEAIGLGSALLEITDEPALRENFGIPDDHGVCCVVVLGFIASTSAFPGRLGLDEVCFGEHFGSPLRWAVEKGPGSP